MLTTSRRDAMKYMLAAGGAAGLPSPAFARAEDPVFAAYQAAAAEDPWTLITHNAPSEGFDGEARRIHGRLPDGLRGKASMKSTLFGTL